MKRIEQEHAHSSKRKHNNGDGTRSLGDGKEYLHSFTYGMGLHGHLSSTGILSMTDLA